jgi:purine-binding chemotaxis protein CheW
MTAELLLFTVGSERFAVPLADVEEAVDLPVIHFVPEMPPSMLGVVSLRGSLVPVFSPAAALGQTLGSRRAALIFRPGTRLVGVVVDDVEDTIVVNESDMRELPATEHDDLVVGVVHHEGHLISVMRAGSLVAACRDARVVTTA